MTALLDRPNIETPIATTTLSKGLIENISKTLTTLKCIENTDIEEINLFQNQFTNLRFLVNQLSKNPDSKKLFSSSESRGLRKYLRENVDNIYRIVFLYPALLPILTDLYNLCELKDVLNRSSAKLEDKDDFPLIDSKPIYSNIKAPKQGLVKNPFIVQREIGSDIYLNYSTYKEIADMLIQESGQTAEMFKKSIENFDMLIWDYAVKNKMIKIYKPIETKESSHISNQVSKPKNDANVSSRKTNPKGLLETIKNFFKSK